MDAPGTSCLEFCVFFQLENWSSCIGIRQPSFFRYEYIWMTAYNVGVLASIIAFQNHTQTHCVMRMGVEWTNCCRRITNLLFAILALKYQHIFRRMDSVCVCCVVNATIELPPTQLSIVTPEAAHVNILLETFTYVFGFNPKPFCRHCHRHCTKFCEYFEFRPQSIRATQGQRKWFYFSMHWNDFSSHSDRNRSANVCYAQRTACTNGSTSNKF